MNDRRPEEGECIFAFWTPACGEVHSGCYGTASAASEGEEMTYREPLTPVPYARRTEPSRSLLQGKSYSPSFNTNVALTLAIARQQQEQTCAQSSQHS